MKKLLSIILIVLVIAAGIFAVGPRPGTDDMISFDSSSIGDDLDSYLANKESAVPNLIDGAQKEIVWVDPGRKHQTDYAILYVHGFSATKQEIRPVPDNVAEALEANLFYMRFTGHGQDGTAMGEATTQSWANDFAEAMEISRRIGKKTIIIATSTGATLSTWASSKPQFAELISGMALISPNFELHGISTSLANIPWAETLLPAIAGQERSWEPINEEHGKWWTTSYPSKAIFPMTSYLKLLKDIDKQQIKIPALFIYSPQDKVILPSEVEKVAAEWGGPKEIMQLETTTDPFHHVIAGDIVSPGNTETASSAIVQWATGL